MKQFRIVSVNISAAKQTRKTPAESITLVEGTGVKGDAHAGPGKRQVSLLASEDITQMRQSGADVTSGDFAENITTEGIDLPALPIGTQLTIGDVVLEVSQIGKKCHTGCDIMKQAGSCIMPSRGIFAMVITGGVISGGKTGFYDR